ncbi:mechanosensitive ion channel family protein [Candidatus Fermentibacteria bacterium]|nr:mechanosensitive ion channel family protein [Candidatus Fermentibacteria bacterium]
MARLTMSTGGATRILTYDNEYLTVPNSKVAKGILLNYSQPPIPKARSFFINIGYEVRPNRVKSVIREAIVSIPEVVSEPSPRVWLMEFGEHAISYRVKFWVRRFEDGYDTNDRVKSQIWYHLNRSGIIVPYPRRTVQILAQEEVSARQSHHVARARQLLRRVPLFAQNWTRNRWQLLLRRLPRCSTPRVSHWFARENRETPSM